MNLPTNVVRKAGVLLRSFVGSWEVFDLIERKYLKGYENYKYIPPTFIVGAPRTGSTLLYHYLVKVAQFSYISNIVSIFYKSPVFFTRIFSGRYEVNGKMENELGLIPGLFSPSEAAKIFERWFENNAFSKENTRFIRKSVSIISKLDSGPFLGKNMNNSMRVYRIREIFPNALFIYLKREPLYNAQSILLARKRREGSIEKWWSTKPNRFKEIVDKSPWEQVIYQVKGIEDYLDRAFGNDKNYTELYYEEFCEDPAVIVNFLREWYRKNNLELVTKDPKLFRESFEVSRDVKLKSSDWDKLVKAYQKIYL